MDMLPELGKWLGGNSLQEAFDIAVILNALRVLRPR